MQANVNIAAYFEKYYTIIWAVLIWPFYDLWKFNPYAYVNIMLALYIYCIFISIYCTAGVWTLCEEQREDLKCIRNLFEWIHSLQCWDLYGCNFPMHWNWTFIDCCTRTHSRLTSNNTFSYPKISNCMCILILGIVCFQSL